MNKTTQTNWWEHTKFINGYGNFPYVILKIGHSLYMQIPIHFNKNHDVINYPGSHINAISETDLNVYENNKLSLLHDKIIEHCQRMKNKIEADKQKTIKMCLIEGPTIAYFFDENGIKFSTDIPSGGVLLTVDHKVIGMNIKHYL